ncbi:ribosome maturation factor RimM [Chloropicon primus]|nr:ribosome maturation factor RimM [Chloropicon primus]|mmetsp:Transcript_10715/g.30182  ORF Transcript_10715/g.30182 Transcript_10715/m.30182 type:complete len:261 (-) Transcript_10715:72-854(-)
MLARASPRAAEKRWRREGKRFGALGPRPPRRTARCRVAGEGEAGVEWVKVGVVTGAHGLRGEVRVKPLTDSAEDRFRPGKNSWLRRKASIFEESEDPVRMEIQFARTVTNRGQLAYLLKLDNVSSRDEAEAVKGHTLLVRTDERDELDGDSEFYAQDLVGLRARVRQEGGEEDPVDLGVVVDVFSGTGVHDTLDIEVCDSYSRRLGKESEVEASKRKRAKVCVLVPFAREIVPVVDTQGGFCEIDPPAGLLEACLYTKKR